jgi:hypothetical protein
MEDQRRQAAEQEAAARRATDAQVLEDAERLIGAWNKQNKSEALSPGDRLTLSAQTNRIRHGNVERLNMKIAVIGVTGRVGSRLATELLSRSHAVTGITLHIPPDLRPGLTVGSRCDETGFPCTSACRPRRRDQRLTVRHLGCRCLNCRRENSGRQKGFSLSAGPAALRSRQTRR